MSSFNIKFIVKSLFVFFFCIFFNVNAANKINNNFENDSDYDIYQNHAFNNSSAIDHGAIEEIDTFKGYLKLSRTDIHFPGPNGMDIDVIQTYTGSRFAKGHSIDFSSGYGWHLNTMKITFFTDFLEKKEGPFFTPDPNRKKKHGAHYGFFPLSAMVQFMDGSSKILNITNYNEKYRHKGFYYAYWPEEAKSTDNWVLHNPYQSREMYLHSPDGKKYTFSIDFNSHKFKLSARLVRIDDLHGNWIQYNYDTIPYENNPFRTTDYLSSIEANDGRRVSFNYKNLKKHRGKNYLRVIDSIVANNQVWHYNYKLSGFKHEQEKERPVLTEVVRPDGTKWEYTYNQSTDESRLITDVKSPSNLRTRYDYRYYKKDNKDFERIATKTQYDSNNNLLGEWHYKINIDKDGKDNLKPVLFVCPNHPELNCTKNVVSTHGIEKYYIFSTAEEKLKIGKIKRYTPVWSHGVLIRSELYDLSANNILVEKEDYKWGAQKISDNKLYFNNKRRDETYNRPILLEKKITRDNTDYLTIYDYDPNDIFGRVKYIKEIGPSGERNISLNYTNYPENHIYNLVTKKDDGVNFSIFSYNPFGKVINENNNNTVNQYEYHNDGNLAKIIDSLGNATRYDNYYRSNSRLITYADNTTEKKEIDDNGNVIVSIDPNGNKTQYRYDNLGRVINVTPPKGVQTDIFYLNNEIITQRANFKEITKKDELGRVISNAKYENNKLLFQEDYRYDSFGREIFKSIPYKDLNNSNGVYKSYDALDRVKNIRSQFDNQSIETFYNYLPNSAIENINPKGHRELIYYQAYGSPSYKNPIKIINANNIETIINRAKDGLIENIKRGNITKYYKYNSNRLLSEYIEPETGSTLYEYDTNGNLILKTNANNQVIQNKYNNRNKLIAAYFNNEAPVKYFSYDNNGNLISAKTQDNEWGYKYDENNNLTNANFVYKDKYFNFEYKYNNLNYLENIIYPSKKEINFNPNILGQVSQIGDFVRDIQYATKGDIVSYNYANGVKFNKLINSRYLPENFSYQLNNRNINVNYTYDILNNITKIINPDNSVLDLGYDNQDRLASVSGLNINGDIQYDKFDNILKNSITNSFYNYDVSNRLVSTESTDIQNFKYDNAGRVINDGLHSYAYSPEDKLISVDDVKYSYDAHGNKISNGESLFIHNKLGQKLLDITDNKYSEYFYLGNLLIAKNEKDLKNNQEKTNYYHNDLLGSVIGSSDENGNIISETLHLPFGLESNNINNNSNEKSDKIISYTGKYKDKKSGLYDFSARHYDAKIGRFTTPDPITFTPKNLISFNRYAYGNNNPYKYVDPDGENPVQIFGYLAVRAVSIISKVLPKYFIRTPYGIARQSFSLKNLKLRKEVKSGKSLYRQGEFDIQNTQDAQFWSAENPLQLRNYADKYGIPEGDGVNWVMKGTIDKETPFVTRDAPGIGSNAGGGSEIVLNSGQVKIQWFHML
tara:strand:- start:10 stop:4377 length:4368 start_codon:yes stop_codon:yes gene_type:complete